MGLFFKDPVEAELKKLERQEDKFFYKRMEKKESYLNQLLAEKVPETMQAKLDDAFAKAFQLIFNRGTGVIEKTYDKAKLEDEYEIKEYAAEVNADRKSLKAFSKGAGKTGLKNLAISGTTGIGMGLMGVGIPDIPVFTGMILKQIYETALNYGFEYESDEEKYFIMMLIQGAVAYGDDLEAIDNQINRYIKTETDPDYIDTDKLIHQTSGHLSKELLYMKFLQGIPVVGAVGGAYDAIYMKRIAEYSELKYRKRFYERKKQ
jgi:hypothetical protein